MTITATPATVAASLTSLAVSPASTKKVVKPAKKKVILNTKQLRAVKTFAKAKEDIKAAEGRKERAEAVLREALGSEFQIGTTEDGVSVVTVMESSNSGYDKDILTSLFPEAAAAAYRKTPYTYLKTA